jgi:lysophospholipase L1-like esterase
MRGTLTLVAAAALAMPAGGGAAAPSALVLGDSLAQGTARYLPDYLPGWRFQQIVGTGVHTAEGVASVRALGPQLPRFIVVSLGTNDDPRLAAAFRASVRSVMDAAGQRRCVVWPTIARPRTLGSTYAGYNRALAAEARLRPNLLVVDWAAMTRAHPEWLRRDGVHASTAGYRARAAAIARALVACPR